MRTPSVDKNGMKKGAWSEEEDRKLRAYILRYGHWNWRLLPKYAGKTSISIFSGFGVDGAGLARCGKSCRLRWVNYLKPGVKLGNYTKGEEDLIAKLHDELGNKWSAIAAKLPGRSDNEVKNYWHTHLKKRRPKTIPSPNSPCKNFLEASSAGKLESSSNVPILESSGSDSGNRGPVSWDSDDSASSSRSADQTSFLPELEPVLAETCYSPIRYYCQNYLSDERASSSDSVGGFEESFWSKPFEVDTSYSQDAVFAPFEEDVFFSYLFA